MASAEEENAYFSVNPAPKHLDQHISLAESFINRHNSESRRVVLITSGGTTVPLEKNTVRFIDNFSAGTRGATSAEHFLEAGYAVIFLHREFSLLPFSRHFTYSTDSFLDLLDDGGDGRVVVRSEEEHKLLTVIRKYRGAKQDGMLLTLPFVTIGDYLHELRAVARLMGPLGPRGLLYLAAAVSDFFVPADRMAEHKIQSTDVASTYAKTNGMTQTNETAKINGVDDKNGVNGVKKPNGVNGRKRLRGDSTSPRQSSDEEFDNFDATPRVPRSKSLVIDLDPVPKFLKNLVDGWAPKGMIVSYKLETDPAILVKKARSSLDRYQHHLVIGNLLATRKFEVVFVSPGKEDNWLRISRKNGWGDAEGRALRLGEVPSEDPEVEVEGLIIPAVAELHDAHVERFGKTS